MKNKFLFTVIITSVCLLIFIVKSFAQTESGTKTFNVNKGGTLNVAISSGDIKIKVWDRNELKINYEIDEDELQYIDLKFNQDGNNISVKSDSYTADLEITVPSAFNLNLNTSGGDITVSENITGKIRINTSGGDIKLNEVIGELIVNTAGGNIKCGNIKGDAKLSSAGGDIQAGYVEGECKINTGGGNVQVNNVLKGLSISTGGGNVKCGDVGSDAKVTTGGGNVAIANVKGTTTITTGGGNISGVSLIKGGKITSGAGNISLKNLSENIKATSGYGNIMVEFASVGKEESKIISGNGNVTVYIPENAKVTIEASVKFSEGKTWAIDKKEISEIIKSEFKAATEDKRKGEYRSVYLINGGGTNIYLQTSIGHIEIKKLKR